MRSPKKTMPSMSPSSISTEKSPPPSDTSMAIVAFDNSTTHLSSSPSPPHSLDHSSDSEKEDEKRRPESRRNKNPVKIEETPSPIVVVHNHNRSVKEVVPTRKTARVGSGRSSGQRSGAVLAILRRSRREEIVKFVALGFRLSEVVLALISFSIMAADKTKGWSGDSFDRYKEYRFCLSVNVVAFIYASFQACDLAYHLVKEKHLISHHLRPLFEFIIDQVLAYLLMCASTAAVTRVDDWVSNWGKDDFTEMASASIAMSFLTFLAFAFSSLISGYNLFNQDSL
ncbi:CASP-like protein 4A3 [Arabidopsis lyrata subsp. lyrata]|nr:CASP-like protein 4A3 [Arabidopsis lyrata subsp. lyrata]|eukprot:XP_020884573.1 CASP-like protein 4A3 [Arabidopsis lyrata subsp. lyrata]